MLEALLRLWMTSAWGLQVSDPYRLARGRVQNVRLVWFCPFTHTVLGTTPWQVAKVDE